jgi:O-phosphoseryl-tRNA(Sec) selenium transferase, SepSecS
VAAELGERVLGSPGNPISIAMTLDALGPAQAVARAAVEDESAKAAACSREQGEAGGASAGADIAPLHAAQQAAGAASGREQHQQEGSAAAAAHHHEGDPEAISKEVQRRVTQLGAMLWQRRVSGVRVVARGASQTVAGVHFEGYGSSCSKYCHHYMTAAAAIGATEEDVDGFVAKLRECYRLCQRRAATAERNTVSDRAPPG